jgi:CheY-like chemotaxis protein
MAVRGRHDDGRIEGESRLVSGHNGSMTPLRILYVDDDPDIREIAEIALGLDPTFAVRCSASAEEALATAAEWSPDLFLCDVMMPGMDGPATLERLRRNAETAKIPVAFMTACAQSHDIERFKSLGAIGVIAKPFDPMKLADTVRAHVRSAKLAGTREGFTRRLRTDLARLSRCRSVLQSAPSSCTALEEIQSLAHALAGAAGIFGFHAVGGAAAALEKSAIDAIGAGGLAGDLGRNLDALVAAILAAGVAPAGPAIA